MTQLHLPVGNNLYKPLQKGEVRLVEIVPGNNAFGFRCSLRTVVLAEVKQTYETLSYVWGDPESTAEIIINNARVTITKGLFEFLQEWHRRTGGSRDRLLWIDAICINQQDIHERSIQVATMRTIYSLSTRTVAWLGSSTGICDDHIPDFKALAEAIVQLKQHDPPSLAAQHTAHSNLWKDVAVLEDTEDNSHFSAQLDCPPGNAPCTAWETVTEGLFDRLAIVRKRIDSEDLPHQNHLSIEGTWKTFHNVATHNYWWRGWVRQEILSSTELVLWHGHSQSSLSHWLIINDWFVQFQQGEKPSFLLPTVWKLMAHIRYKMITMRYFFPMPSMKPESDSARQKDESRRFSILRSFVVDNKQTRTSDPRDKIFAFSGLSGLPYIPDYSLSIEQVYIGFVLKAWVEIGDSSFLALAGSDHLNESHYKRFLGYRLFLPSWVPNWHMMGHQKGSRPSYIGYAASVGLSSPGMSFLHYEHALKVTGVQVGTIASSLAPVFENGMLIDNLLTYLFNSDNDDGSTTSSNAHKDISRGKRILSLLCSDEVWEAELPQLQVFAGLRKKWIASNFLFLIICMWLRRSDIPKARPLQDTARDGSLFRKRFMNADDGIGWTYHELATLDSWLFNPPVRIDLTQLVTIFTNPFQHLRVSIDSQMLITTRNGWIGWAPTDTELGDTLWIIPGCPLPVALRRLDDGQKYIHLGPCVCPGLMNGEMARDILHSDTNAIKAATSTILLR